MQENRESKKLYVLDTNVLMHDPKALFAFVGSHIGIPMTVLEELDQFKIEHTDRGRNAREAVRTLDDLRHRGSLREGVKTDNGSIIQVFLTPAGANISTLPLASSPDNSILEIAYNLKQQGYHVVFISKDINARVKGDAIGLQVEDYLKGRVAEYELYKGWRAIDVPAVSLKRGEPGELHELLEQEELALNEFILVQSNNNIHNYRVFRYLGNKQFRSVVTPALEWPLTPRNPQQLMALDLLLDRDIQLVTLVGPAGTGKTFLALLAGLHQVLIKNYYEKIMISRPVIPLGPDIGFLPGDIQEKLHSWMQPIYDNMTLIAHAAASKEHIDALEQEGRARRDDYRHQDHYAQKGMHKKSGQDRYKDKKSRVGTLDSMINSGKISLDAITYMRGRSIPYQFILIDEVQNLTPHEVKTLVTRVGQGSKIILAGDPYQIDSAYLDFSSNGLTVTGNAFKGQSVFGTVFLQTSERSELSRLAGDLL
jgi:PhoH-like ATPase